MGSRRQFLKLTGALALSLALPRNARALSPYAFERPRAGARGIDWRAQNQALAPGDFPAGVPLGRGALGWGAPILSRPHPEGTLLGHVYPNDVVRVVRTVVGLGMAY